MPAVSDTSSAVVVLEMPKSSTLRIGSPVGRLGEEEIARLQVAVDDAERVGFCDGLAGLQEQIDRLRDRKLSALEDHAGEVPAAQALHDHERRAVDRVDAVHGRHVLVVDAGSGACFALEAGDDVGLVAQSRQEELDGDEPVQLRIVGGEDATHAAFAEAAGDLVLAQDDVADFEGVQGASGAEVFGASGPLAARVPVLARGARGWGTKSEGAGGAREARRASGSGTPVLEEPGYTDHPVMANRLSRRSRTRLSTTFIRHAWPTTLLPAVAALCSSCSGSDRANSTGDAGKSPLLPEVGFVDLPPQATAAAYAARMFYAFRPADESPESHPLLVFYDGGPGSPTSANLLVYGTGPMTLDQVTAVVTSNPGSFSRFANLLYLDERQAGFSYGLGAGDAGDFGCTFSVLDDATDFIRAIGSFLETHPSLSQTKIVLVGESYGGLRTTGILHLASSYADTTVAMPSDVRAILGTHAAQLGQAVLIEPLVAGDIQVDAQNKLKPEDPYLPPWPWVHLDGGLAGPDGGCVDPYDVQKPCGWSSALIAGAAAALAGTKPSTALLGVDLGTVVDLLPAARADAFRTPWAAADPSENALVARFGPLRSRDSYWSPRDVACHGYNDSKDKESATWLVSVLLSSKLFITNARYDSVVYAPAIPYLLEHDLGLATSVDTTPEPGVARPGTIHVSIPTDAGSRDIQIRFPSYDASGHKVAVTQGADLAADVEAWPASTE